MSDDRHLPRSVETHVRQILKRVLQIRREATVTSPAPRPRVRLPSPRDINPNLTTLIGLVETVIAEQGPAAAAHMCAKLSAEIGRAAEHPSVAGYLGGPFVVSADCLAAAAEWFSEAAVAARACQQ